MKFLNIMIAASLLVGFASCSNDDNSDEPTTALFEKEKALKAAALQYVNKTVLPTYGEMADAAVEMCALCETMQQKLAAGSLTTADVVAAGDAWKRSRKYWELSEAFLFGPAANHNIDPHIDSWPLDKAQMQSLLATIRSGYSWSTDALGYGLLGFHSIEYMLYELSDDGRTSHPHSLTYTPEELEYLVGVARDLRDQCVLLEACWAGDDAISAQKLQILEDADLGYGENYGSEMINAGSAGSRFKTYQEVAEEIVQGCIDIADEVGNTKIGRPHSASSVDDRNYIESPYSLNSIEDFAYNIRSIENSYIGVSGASISDYVKKRNPQLDAKVRRAIADAIAAIEAIPEPFALHATEPAAGNAVTVVGTYLVDVLQELYTFISHN